MAVYLRRNSSIVLVRPISIANKVKNAHGKHVYFRRSGGGGRRWNLFCESLDAVFEVLKCQCRMIRTEKEEENCEVKITVDCNCAAEDRIPQEEVEFFFEQRHRAEKDINGETDESEVKKRTMRRKKVSAKDTL